MSLLSDLFKTNDVSVGDRQFLHEIFDWRCTDEHSEAQKTIKLFFEEIEEISNRIYKKLSKIQNSSNELLSGSRLVGPLT